ncbi:MAG: hypothetical protein DRQ55_14040 [Planctomycetota bacterium]|nr:MAG: hypothetical protein DRQ55_14040 [Planctomycetota bacterium]
MLTARPATPLAAKPGRVAEIVDLAFPDGAPFDVHGKGSRETFLAVLQTELFLHEAVGPFDVYLMLADGWARSRDGSKAMKAVVKGLQPTVQVMSAYFGKQEGLIGGRRLPIVLTHASRAEGERSFDQVVALLEWAEDDYSGWKQGGNPLNDAKLLAGLNVRTWEVQVFNLAHEFAQSHGKDFLNHGLGYYQLAHVAARVLRQGAWGMVPPWLAQGITDELDIAAYDEAWVGGDLWIRQTPGWFRPGWSGFVPQGSAPPPAVTGPPADLAVTVRNTGDSWQRRSSSNSRHWENLVTDLKSDAPASFSFMADNESFMPRDRALSRATLHVMLELAAPTGRQGLLSLLDRVPTQPPSGMFDSDPITVAFNKALGGVPAVDELEAMSMEEMLVAIGHSEIIERLKAAGAGEMLRIPDHREQAEWLYRRPQFDGATRQRIWNDILEAEYFQQLAEWKHLGAALDRGMRQTFQLSKRYPKRERDVERVAEAFWQGVQDS